MSIKATQLFFFINDTSDCCKRRYLPFKCKHLYNVFQMEQFSDDELDHAAEEDSDKEDQDLDKMFGAWLGELDKLTKVRLTDQTDCESVPCCCADANNVILVTAGSIDKAYRIKRGKKRTLV